MTWNYRVIRHDEGHLALHEVYYDDDGKPNRVTTEPVTFVAESDDGITGLINSLELALNDARERPALDFSMFSKDNEND
jgi:hypothetical protein